MFSLILATCKQDRKMSTYTPVKIFQMVYSKFLQKQTHKKFPQFQIADQKRQSMELHKQNKQTRS